MILIEDENIIKKHNTFIRTTFLQYNAKEFFFHNIFNSKFKYLLFVEEFDFTGYLFEGLKDYLNEIGESDFFVSCLTSEDYIIPYSINKSSEAGYTNFRQEEELEITLREFFGGLNKPCLEYLYYSKTATWCGYFNTLEEIGIFGFETKDLAKSFMNKFDNNLFYTPQEVIDEIWQKIRDDYKEAFLKNYAPMSLLKNIAVRSIAPKHEA